MRLLFGYFGKKRNNALQSVYVFIIFFNSVVIIFLHFFNKPLLKKLYRLNILKYHQHGFIIVQSYIHQIPDSVCYCIEVGFQLLGEKYFLQRRKYPGYLTHAILSTKIALAEIDVTIIFRIYI